MNKLKLMALGLSVLTCMTGYAQDDKESSDKAEGLYQEIYMLRKNLDEKEKALTAMQLKYDKQTASLEKVKEDLQAEKDSPKSNKIKELTLQLKENEKQLTQLQLEKEGMTTQFEQAASAKEEEWTKQHELDLTQIKTLSLQKDSLALELANLNKFKRMWLRQLAESVDETWLNKPFSEIDEKRLDKSCLEYGQYAADDEKVKTAYESLMNLKAEYAIYAEGIACVYSQYESQRVQTAYSKVETLRDKYVGAKEDEIDALVKQLGDYEVTVEIFVDVIKAVDEVIEGMTNPWPLARAVMEKQEKDEGYISAIQAIPWLNQQYNQYCSELMEGVAENSVRILILDLVLE